MGDIKRSPQNVLNSLSKHSSDVEYRFERLYRNLYNEEMFYRAYQNIYAKPGNMTKGADGKTIDGMSIARIDRLMSRLKNESYQPQPSRRTYILKKNGKKRPLGIPSFDDKLVQEVIRMILEAIYEGSFSNLSHGFRPKRSCQTALLQCQRTYGGAKWFIEGDIQSFFENIKHDVLITVLEERISDNRFIRLIRKFLNAGYVEDWKFYGTYSGTPQGGIVSPILANIYLDKFDKYMEKYLVKFDKGRRRERNVEQRKYEHEKRKLNEALKSENEKTKRRSLIKSIKDIEQKRLAYHPGDEMDKCYRRLKYVRYADDFLIGVIGSKEECKQVKEDIKAFLKAELKLDLSESKTLITHANKSAKFLGYEVYIRDSNGAKRDNTGRLSRRYNKKVVLKLSIEVVKKKLIEYDVLRLEHHEGNKIWKSKCRTILINNDDLEILHKFNTEIRGFYNYYRLANNCATTLSAFKYIMEYSMYKTYAGKYKSTVRKIINKYTKDGNFTVYYTNKKGQKIATHFYNKGFKRETGVYVNTVDTQPSTLYTKYTTSLISRLIAEKCELCGAAENLKMHHVKRVKDLEGKELWEKVMIARLRKTLAVCHQCHTKIHHGID